MSKRRAARAVRRFSHSAVRSPAFAAILLHSLARFLAAETELGVSEGHASALGVVDWYIDRYDGAEPSLESRLKALEAENAHLRSQLAPR